MPFASNQLTVAPGTLPPAPVVGVSIMAHNVQNMSHNMVY